jgi:SAM-dependent methyltransferase
MVTLTSIHRLLAAARGYDFFQRALGGDAARRFVTELLQPPPTCRILDLGCGTARILDWLPDSVSYVGVDSSPRYIAAARHRYGARGTFRYAEIGVEVVELEKLPVEDRFDIVLAKGVLHHLDDREAYALIDTAHAWLRPGGQLVTLDPVRHDGQARLARLLIVLDRGRYVRRPEQYRALAEGRFAILEARVLTGRLRVPYSHFFLRAER